MVATVNVRSDDFNLTNRNPWFSSFLVAATLYQGNPDRVYWINREICTPYADAAGMLVYINEKFKMGKIKSFFLS